MSYSYKSIIAVAMLTAGALCCSAQQLSFLSFAYQLPGAASVTLAGGGTIPFPATSTGSSSSVSLLVTNQGSTLAITAVSVSNTAYAVSPATASLPSGTTTPLTVTFSPTLAGATTATLTLTLSSAETVSFQLNSTAVAANFVTSYSITPNGNQTVVTNQGTILFPSTSVGQSSTAIFVITNQGASAGTVTSASLAASSSTAFQITGRPLLPAQVNPGNNLAFNIVFTPTTTDLQTGTLQVSLFGNNYTFVLQGSGSGASYTYQTIASGGSTSTVQPNGTIAFPNTNLGSTSTLNVSITNSGNAAGQIATATVNGGGFQRTDTVPLPITLSPGGTLTLTITFAPNSVGALTGTLIVGSAVFTLQGTGLGPNLTFQFQVAGTSVTVANQGVVNFPNTNVGSSTTASLLITNAGNLSGTINSLNVTPNSAFSAKFPSLPATIGVGKTVSIPLTFTPTAVGSQTATLTVDSSSITLQGVGGSPALVSGYSFTGLGGTVTPLTQPSVGLTLSQPYPVDITGQLTLSFNSGSFADDPTIQFATGGRTVSFTVPANTKTAVFGTSGTTVQFQSGTVAGTIVLTPSFSLGSVNISPPSAQPLSTVVAAGPPQLTSANLGTLAATTVQLIINGFSTTRSVDTLTFQITPASGSNVENTTLSADVTSAFSSWYQSAPSDAVGSQFSATVTISVSGGTTDAITSVSITATNGDGTSQAVSVALR